MVYSNNVYSLYIIENRRLKIVCITLVILVFIMIFFQISGEHIWCKKVIFNDEIAEKG